MGVKLELFATEEHPRACQAGEKIFEAYDMGAEMYVILDGEVDLAIGDKVVETLGPGEPFGEMALIDQAPRTATATARSECTLAVIPEKRFLFLVAQQPQFALQIMKVMADRLRKMNARL